MMRTCSQQQHTILCDTECTLLDMPNNLAIKCYSMSTMLVHKVTEAWTGHCHNIHTHTDMAILLSSQWYYTGLRNVTQHAWWVSHITGSMPSKAATKKQHDCLKLSWVAHIFTASVRCTDCCRTLPNLHHFYCQLRLCQRTCSLL